MCIYINVYRVVVLPIVFFYPSCAILVMIAIPIDSRLWLKHVFQPATSGSLPTHCRLVLGGFRLPKSIVTMTTTPIELYKLFPLHCINQWWLNRVSTKNRCSIIKLRWLMNMMKPSTSLFHWLTHGAGVSLLHHEFFQGWSETRKSLNGIQYGLGHAYIWRFLWENHLDGGLKISGQDTL